MTAPADRHAARFAADGDPRALAALFDATAGELLRVARWLTGDPHAAEDVVQETFLTFVDRAAELDRDRPVLPWMVGIAANHARRWRAHRTRQRVLTAQRQDVSGTDSTAEDPAAAVAAADLRDQLLATVDRLPRPTAQVLRLHLEHDLAPQQIARALDRPAGTVRSQLSRGLEHLRRALPAGIAGATAVIAPMADLAAMRRRVLAHTPAGATGAAAAAWPHLFGLLLMKTSLWIAGVGLLLIAALAVWSPPPPPSAAAPAAATPAAAAPTGIGEAVAAETDRRPLAPRTTGARSALRGRAIAMESGAPLSGVEFVLLTTPRDHAHPQRVGRTTTGADGRFSLPLPADATSLQLHGSAAGRVDISGTVRGDDLGDLALPRATAVTLRIVDSDLAPVLGVRLALHRDRAWPEQALLPRTPALGSSSDANGEIDAGELAVGRWRIEPRWPHTTAAPVTIDVAAPGPHHATIVLRGRTGSRVIAGTAVDEAGRPVAGVTVMTGGASLTSVETGADGRFRLTPAELVSAGPHAELSVFAPDGYDAPTPRVMPWGETDVTITLTSTAGSRVAVQLLDAETGTPIADFVVRCAHARGGALLRARSDPETRAAVLRGVRAGANFITAFPADERALPSETTRYDHRAGASPTIRLNAPPALPLRVEVRRASGEPVAATRVELLRTPRWVREWSAAAARIEWNTVSRPAEPADNPDGYSHGPTLIDHGISDRDGVVTLRAGRGLRYSLRALGPGHAPSLSTDVAGEAGTVRLTVADGARLTGRITNAPPRCRFGRLALVEIDGARVLPNAHVEELAATADRLVGITATMAVGSDGSFDFHGLPAGRWRAVLERFEIGGVTPAWNRLALADEIRLTEGQTTALTLDGSRLALGMLHGQIHIDRPPARTAIGRLSLEAFELGSAPDSGLGRQAATAVVAADGRFAFANLPAGRYRLWAEATEGSTTATWRLTDWLSVRPGTTHTIAPKDTAHAVTLALRRDGEPARATGVWLWSTVAAGGARAFGHSDDDGNLRIPALPPGRYEVRRQPQRASSLAVTLAGTGGALVSIALPPEW